MENKATRIAELRFNLSLGKPVGEEAKDILP